MKLHRRQKEFLRRIRLPFEWAGIGVGWVLFAYLPFRVLLAVCDFASAVMYFFDRRGRRLSLYNLRIIKASSSRFPIPNPQFSILNSQFPAQAYTSRINDHQAIVQEHGADDRLCVLDMP